jgi:hypothetical protein
MTDQHDDPPIQRNKIYQKMRNPFPEGKTIKKELAFNSYIEQLEDPRSFINTVPEFMRDHIIQLPEELIHKDEDTLLEILKTKYNFFPTPTLEALRNNFWMEYDRVSATRNEVMNQNNIFLGVVARQNYNVIVKSYPHYMAYILCRPPEYAAIMNGLLNLSTRRIRDILNLPLQKSDGSMQDAKIIELVLKAAAMVDLRAKGGYIQRSETKNLTLMKQENSYTNVFQAASSDKPFDVSKISTDIDAKIAALEKEMAAIPGVGHQSTVPANQQMDVIEVTVTKKGEIV